MRAFALLLWRSRDREVLMERRLFGCMSAGGIC